MNLRFSDHVDSQQCLSAQLVPESAEDIAALTAIRDRWQQQRKLTISVGAYNWHISWSPPPSPSPD